MGNRPAMLLKRAESKRLTFDSNKSCGINAAKESHMHSATLRIDDADTITTRSKASMYGRAMEEHPTILNRAKS